MEGGSLSRKEGKVEQKCFSRQHQLFRRNCGTFFVIGLLKVQRLGWQYKDRCCREFPTNGFVIGMTVMTS